MKYLNIVLSITAATVAAVFVSGCREEQEPELKKLYADEVVIVYSINLPGSCGNPGTRGFIIKTIHDEEHYGRRKDIPGTADRSADKNGLGSADQKQPE
jgi:hypothetical protein